MNFSKNQSHLYPLGKYKSIIKDQLLTIADLRNLLPDPSALADHIFDHGHVSASGHKDPFSIYIETLLGSDAYQYSTTQKIYVQIDVLAGPGGLALSAAEQQSAQENGYAGNRVDIALDIIDRMLLNMDIGLGRMQRRLSDPMTIRETEDGLYGKQIIYFTADFKAPR